MIWNFLVISVKNFLLVIIMLYTVICNKWVHISCNNFMLCIVLYWYCNRKPLKDSTSCYCKNCLKQKLSFDKLNGCQLKALMLNKVFSDEECENEDKTELIPPDNFHQINNINLNNLFFHMNISSVSHYIGDLNILKMNCKNKLKVIGISKCWIKTARPPPSNITMNNYEIILTWTYINKYCFLLTYMFIYMNTPTESKQGCCYILIKHVTSTKKWPNSL